LCFPTPLKRFNRTGQEPRPAGIREAYNAALERAGIEDFTFHDLRHTAASHLAMNGCGLNELAAILGHKTLAMVNRYSHFTDAHLATAMERMNKKVFGE
jgi:integrase